MAARDLQGELMDDPGIDPAAHRAALAGLARLNRLAGSARFVWSQFADLLARSGSAPLRLLDIATGSADVPIALARRAIARRSPLEITACDASTTAIDEARRRAERAGVEIDLRVIDVLRDPLPGPADVVTISLFLHHLDESAATNLLKRAAEVVRARLVVHELNRGAVGALLVNAAARLVTRSRIVHVDAARSMRAAFTAAELRSIADRAGLRGAEVFTPTPWRLALRWDPPAATADVRSSS